MMAPESLFACHQCYAAICGDGPGPHEPEGLCATGADLYATAAEWAGLGLETGRWAAYDAACAAYHAHVYGEVADVEARAA